MNSRKILIIDIGNRLHSHHMINVLVEKKYKVIYLTSVFNVGIFKLLANLHFFKLKLKRYVNKLDKKDIKLLYPLLFIWLDLIISILRLKKVQEVDHIKIRLFNFFARKYIKQYNPDIVISFNLPFNLFSYAKKINTKVVTIYDKGGALPSTISSFFSFETSSENRRILMSFQIDEFSNKRVNRFLNSLNNIDYALVPSNYVKKSFDSFNSKTMGKIKPVIIPYGVESQSNAIRHFPVITSGSNTHFNRPLLIAMVGKMTYLKGFHIFMDIISEFNGDNRFKFIFIGPLDKRLMIKEKLSNIIQFTGRISHSSVLSSLNKVDIVIMPTLTEGLSYAILEALSKGCIVLTTENSGLLEHCDLYLKRFISPINDSESVIDNLKYIIENPEIYADIISKVSELSSNFTIDRYKKNIIEFIEGLNDEK